MKERPILFNGAMVRAILDGRKTQTRRVVNPVGNDGGFVLLDYGDGFWPYRSDDGDSSTHTVKRGGNLYHDETPHSCPYGQPSDRLWVRETWAEVGTADPGLMVYRADYPACVPSQYENVPPASEITWKPSIHMFRSASRINLEITAVRVERLNDVSEDDAMAEGVTVKPCNPSRAARMGRDAYAELWESINGPGSWAENPWVWVVEFRRMT